MNRIVPPLHDRHAPTTLQDAFYEAMEIYEDWALLDPEPMVRLEGKEVPVSSIFGRMRGSDDIVPEKVRLAFRAAASPLSADLASRDLTYAIVASRMRELCLDRLRDKRR